MKLLLDRDDLKEGNKNLNCSQTNIDHFKEEVQKVIVMVGRAQFREYDNSNYNTIYPTDLLLKVSPHPFYQEEFKRNLIDYLDDEGNCI